MTGSESSTRLSYIRNFNKYTLFNPEEILRSQYMGNVPSGSPFSRIFGSYLSSNAEILNATGFNITSIAKKLND